MITCPECGLEAPASAKFCDRCGQGLSASAAPGPVPSSRPPALQCGALLKGDFEIIELTGQDSIENRYRASRKGNHETVRLRERFGPAAEENPEQEPTPEEKEEPARGEDPAGPRAKTAELKPLTANGGAAQSKPEPMAEPAQPPAELQAANEAAAAPEPEIPAGGETQSEPQPASGADNAPSNGEVTAGTEVAAEPAQEAAMPEPEDLGDVFGRVRALSMTLNHPAFEKAQAGFANDGRVYLVYRDSQLTSLSRRPGGVKMSEPEAIAIAVQVCQAVGFLHRRGLRLNDICPESVAFAPDGRIKLTGLDYVSNDNELQADPIFNDGFSAPEIYRGRKVGKQADVFSIGALLYTMLTGARLEAETWREEAGPVHFYPPHVVAPALSRWSGARCCSIPRKGGREWTRSRPN